MKKTAFITGSSKGIGKAIALRLAEDGYQVIIHGSKPSEDLDTTEKELKKLGASTLTVCFDISNMKHVALGRPGTPLEVANIVSYLASSESAYITGEVLHVNGGWL